MSVQHADIDLLPTAGSVPMAQRRQNPDAAIEPGEQIRERNSNLLRLTLRLPGETHDAAHGLDQTVVARPHRIGPDLPKAGDRTVDQRGKLLVQLLIAETVFRQRPNLEIFGQNVALGDQSESDLLAFRLGNVERD